VKIDGYTQVGASPNTLAVGNNAVLKVVIDGTNSGAIGGLLIDNSSNSVIKGLVINRFTSTASQVPPAGTYILGDSVGNRIQGNFLGTSAAGAIDQGKP